MMAECSEALAVGHSRCMAHSQVMWSASGQAIEHRCGPTSDSVFMVCSSAPVIGSPSFMLFSLLVESLTSRPRNQSPLSPSGCSVSALEIFPPSLHRCRADAGESQHELALSN